MTADLHEQVALVTGAGRGIGKAISFALAAQGAHVFLAARTSAEIEQAAQQIIKTGGRATAVTADLTDESQIVGLFEQIASTSRRLDILINNAGIGFFSPVSQITSADIDAMLAINVRGTLLCCREALKLMIPKQSGYIINISSVTGFKGYPTQAAYGATKHAVMGITKSLAVESQPHGIRVSAILPGGVNTEMIATARPDLNRNDLIQPTDIANTVLYLLSLTPTNAAIDEIYIRRKTGQPF